MLISKILSKSGHHRFKCFQAHNISAKLPTKELTGQKYSANEFVPADIVEVHDLHVQGALPDLLPRHVEGKGVVEHGIQGALEHGCFALLYALVAELKPDFYVWIWNIRRFKNIASQKLVLGKASGDRELVLI